MIVFSNGRYHSEEEPAVTLGNGGFLHGNGVFTTLRLYGGRPLDLHPHYRRLQEHGRRLGLDKVLNTAELTEVISELSSVNNLHHKDMRLRITWTQNKFTEFLALVPGPLPDGLHDWQNDGIKVITLGHQYQRTHLPQLKTLNYLPSILALQRAEKQGCPEAIILDPESMVLEGSVSNIFILRQGTLTTPEADGRILAGRTRDHVLALAGQLGLPAREKALGKKELHEADEIFMTNSVREIVPVIAFDGFQVGTGQPGEVVKLLQDHFRRMAWRCQ